MKSIVALLTTILIVGCSGRHHHNSHGMGHMHSVNYPGCGFEASVNAGMIARELTDEEMENAKNGHGCGIHEALEVASHPDEYACVTVDVKNETYTIDSNGCVA